MKIVEIRERSDGELRTLVAQLHEDLYKLRVRKATNQLENTNSIRQTRHNLARAMTVLRARVLGREASKGEKA